MLANAHVLDCAPRAPGSEDGNLEALQHTARQLERGGDWAAALMTYELILLQTQRAGLEPDPRLFIKLGDLLVKTDSPGVAVGMFERAATRFAAEGSHQSLIALGIKILRTDRRRQDVFVRFAKQLLEHGYVEEARLVLVDYAERAWARTALRTLKRLERRPASETLRTLRRLIQGVEASFATDEMRGESVGPTLRRPADPPLAPDGTAASERLDQPQDVAAVEANRPRHRGLQPTRSLRPTRRIGLVGVASAWPRVLALGAGTAARLLPAAVPVPQQDGPARLDVLRARIRRASRDAWNALAARVAHTLAKRLPRWIPAALAVVTVGLLAAPPVYQIMQSEGRAAASTEPIRSVAFSPPAPTIATMAPVHTRGGFLSVRDTAVAPLRWDGIVDVPPTLGIIANLPAADSLPTQRQ